ncbi:methyl-accepting chemotaxis protein [Methylobacterium oxalidis]|uniref:Methyl-accepting chemotaxis protein n=1 Tax=Methylobacterium oxalidis TaxID=944322 RepID=A0A512J068_9HYPH|nr:methyl-accepting chemotaxis protein [Methylobacterium oxalidis]
MFRVRQCFRGRLGLRWQIALLGMGGVLLLGVVHMLGQNRQDALQRVADRGSELHAAMIGIHADLGAARQAETEFLLDRREALIAKRETLVARVGERLRSVEAAVADSPADSPLKQAEAIRPSLNLYATRFQNVAAAQRTLGLTEKDGVQGALREAVHAAEKRLLAVHEPDLKVLMLMMRRHEKDFILRGDDRYVDELRDRVSEFKPALSASSLAPQVRAELAALVAAYEARFLAYSAGASTLREEAQDLSAIYGRLAPLVGAVEQAVEQEHDRTSAEMAAARSRTTQAMWAVIAATVLCAGALSLWVGQRLSGPLTMMAGTMTQLSEGNLDVLPVRIARQDEIGAIARALAVFHAKMIENRALLADQEALRERGEMERRDAILRLADRIEEEVGQAASELSATADAMREGAGTLSQVVEETRNRAVAASSEEASANVRMVASAAEELTASFREIDAQVGRSTAVTRRAAEDAARSDATVRALEAAAARIGDVASLIAGIAAQTNLLALNATIEAARAGEAGRGFAVVAGEVKALAGHTATATAEIRGQIEAIRSAATGAVEAIGGIGATVREIDAIAAAIAGTVAQQRAATQEIAGNVLQAARGTQEVTETIARVGHDVGQAVCAARDSLAAARIVSARSSELQGLVGRFLVQVR